MNTCSFTYVTVRTRLSCHTTGVERTWEYLKQEFNRNGDALPDATYYETIGLGPQLFAVVNNQVYYHYDNEWVPYQSATDVSYGTLAVRE